MKIAKPFLRGGVVLQPGDPVPRGLDAETIAHYQRHGMVTDGDTPTPTETKPAGLSPRRRTPAPANTQTVAPKQTAMAPTNDVIVGNGAESTLDGAAGKDQASEQANPKADSLPGPTESATTQQAN